MVCRADHDFLYRAEALRSDRLAVGMGAQSHLDRRSPGHHRSNHRVSGPSVEIIDGEEYGTQPERPGNLD